MKLDEAYSTLELSPPVDIPEIKRAYRKLAIRYHPDKNKDRDAVQKFQNISNAYQTLLTNFEDVKPFSQNLSPTELFSMMFPFIKKTFDTTCSYIVENGLSIEYIYDIAEYFQIDIQSIRIYVQILWSLLMNTSVPIIPINFSLSESYNSVFVSKTIKVPFFDEYNRLSSYEVVVIVNLVTYTILCSPKNKNTKETALLQDLRFDIGLKSDNAIIIDHDIYLHAKNPQIKIHGAPIELPMPSDEHTVSIVKELGLFRTMEKKRANVYIVNCSKVDFSELHLPAIFMKAKQMKSYKQV